MTINLKEFVGSGCVAGAPISFSLPLFGIHGQGHITDLTESFLRLEGEVEGKGAALGVTVQGPDTLQVVARYGSRRFRDGVAHYHVKRGSIRISADIDDDPEHDVDVRIEPKGEGTRIRVKYAAYPGVSLVVKPGG